MQVLDWGACMTELKNCPFCGSSNLDHCKTGSYWIDCLDCGASQYGAKTKEQAIKNWNKRECHIEPIIITLENASQEELSRLKMELERINHCGFVEARK